MDIQREEIMNTELQKLEERKDYLKRELQDVEDKLEKAKKAAKLEIAKGRYARIVDALKAGKSFIIRLNPGCGNFITLLIIQNLEVRTDSPVFEYECVADGIYVELYENFAFPMKLTPIQGYAFNSHRFGDLDVYDVKEYRKIIGKQKEKLDGEVNTLKSALKFAVQIQ